MAKATLNMDQNNSDGGLSEKSAGESGSEEEFLTAEEADSGDEPRQTQRNIPSKGGDKKKTQDPPTNPVSRDKSANRKKGNKGKKRRQSWKANKNGNFKVPSESGKAEVAGSSSNDIGQHHPATDTSVAPMVTKLFHHQRLLEKFFDLLECGGEQTHLDFKASFYSLDPKLKAAGASKSQGHGTNVREDNEFLKDVMSMYNAPEKAFPSLTGDGEASYLVYGISWTKTEKKSTSFKEGDSVRDQSDIQNLVRTRLTPEITIHQHEVMVNLASIGKDRRKRLSFLKETDWEQIQTYYIVEILHDRTKGPLITRHATDKKNRGEKNSIAEALYTRSQATNRKINWTNKKPRDEELRKAVYGKFSNGYELFSGTLKDISSSIQQAVRDHENQTMQYWSLRVLVITPPQFHDEKTFEEIAESLDSSGWNIIIDLDPASTERGFFEKLRKVHLKNWDLVQYTDICNVEGRRGPNLDDVRRGVHFLYLLLRGDTSVDIKEPEHFPYSDTCNIFVNMFKKWDANVDLELFCLSTSQECYHVCRELISQIESRWSEHITSDAIECRVISLSNHQATLIRSLEPDSDWRLGLGTNAELSAFFYDIAKEKFSSDESRVRIPSRSNQEAGVVLSAGEFVTIEKVFTLYHMDFGYPGTDVVEETLESETRKKFLQGFKLNGTSLYVHDICGRVYGERTLTKLVEDRLRNKLSTLEHHCRGATSKSGDENIITIQHEPSAGGTTVGRTVLWHLRKQWPCLELLVLKDDAWPAIETVLMLLYFQKARKPLCILIDQSTVGSHLSKRDIRELFMEKVRNVNDANDYVQVVVLFVEQVLNLPENIGNTLGLSAKLDQREAKDFDALYKKAKESLKNTPHKTVPLYGLCQFNKNYERLDEVLKGLEECTPAQKGILIFASVLWKYAEIPLSNPILAKELEQGSSARSTQKLLTSLGRAKNVLLVTEASRMMDSKHHGIRPPSRYVAEKIIQKCLLLHSLQKFLSIFVDICEGTIPIANALDALVFPIFIQRFRIFHEKRNITTREHFSNFISDLEDEIVAINPGGQSAPTKVANHLKRLVDKIANCNLGNSSHCRAMFARYLNKRCGKIDQALDEMRKAIYVSPNDRMSSTRLTDSSLLITAGHLISMKVRGMKGQHNFRISAGPLMEDGIEILERAEERGNAGAYTVEAKLRLFYLEHCFEFECYKDRSHFSIMLRDDRDPFVKDAVRIIWRKLNDMDQKMYELHYESCDDLAEIISLDVKVNIISMLIDSNKQTTDALLKEAVENEEISKCVVPFVMRKNKMKFENFDDDQMVAIATCYANNIHSLEREQFRNGILAQIYVYNRMPPRMLREMEKTGSSCNMQLAMLFAERWASLFPSDNRALYIMAVLKLGSALSEAVSELRKSERDALLDEFWDLYHKVMEIDQARNRSSSGLSSENRKKRILKREMGFVLQKSEFPLKVLRPKDSLYSLPKKATDFIEFEGKADVLSKERAIFCKSLTTRKNRRAVIKIPILEYQCCRTLGSNQPTYSFILRIDPHGLHAERICSVDGQPVLSLGDSPRSAQEPIEAI